MSNVVKTAISLQKPLFDQIEILAHDLKIPRSRVFTLAIEDFLKRYDNKKLLEKINAAYDDLPDPEEQTLLRHMRSKQRQVIKEEQW